MDCLFCRLVRGEIRSWVVAQDDEHVACLTPFPNTPGFTVVLTKAHRSSYVLSLDPDVYTRLLLFARDVGLAIDRGLGTRRTALIAEGMGVDHTHVKLVPLHGIPEGPWSPVIASEHAYTETYQGYVTSLDGPKAADATLDEVAARIRNGFSSAPGSPPRG